MKKMEETIEETVDFDLSLLSLEELVEVYQNIEEFEKFLGGSKVEVEESKK